MNPSTKVLGLSVGTRSLGYAIYHNATLHDWRTRSFKEKWSDEKLHCLCKWLHTIVKENNITAIAMKIPHPAKTSSELQQLIAEIKKLAKAHGIDLRIYTIEDLNEYCFSKIRSNKATLMDFIAGKYFELTREYEKEKNNRNSYHVKTFEAIAAACVMNQW